MQKFKVPTDFHPDLLMDRLFAVGEVLATAKNELFAAAALDASDGGWGVGCHGADRGRLRLRLMAETTEWLDFKPEGSLSYWLRIGAVPIRVSRADVDPPTMSERQRAALDELKKQLPLEFPDFTPERESFELRLQLDQTSNNAVKDRRVERAYLRILEGDNEIASWQVWPELVAGVAPIPPSNSPIPLRPSPVSLPQAEFEIIADKDNAGSGD